VILGKEGRLTLAAKCANVSLEWDDDDEEDDDDDEDDDDIRSPWKFPGKVTSAKCAYHPEDIKTLHFHRQI